MTKYCNTKMHVQLVIYYKQFAMWQCNMWRFQKEKKINLLSWSVHIPPEKTLKMRTWKLVKSITFHSTKVLSTRLSFRRYSCLSNILSILPLKYSQRLLASFSASFPILDWLYINGFLQKSSETGSYLHAYTTLVTYKYKNLE